MPPPAAFAAVIAWLTAVASLLVPLPVAPKSRTLKTRRCMPPDGCAPDGCAPDGCAPDGCAPDEATADHAGGPFVAATRHTTAATPTHRTAVLDTKSLLGRAQPVASPAAVAGRSPR